MTPRLDPAAPVRIVGGGPAGLAAAEVLAAAGRAVVIHDRMPSLGRKFLLAGRGGLNLTHSEPMPGVLARYGAAAVRLESALAAFDAPAMRVWAEGLGEPTFVGSSGRVFPRSFKASPLLRAWLRRLDGYGVRVRQRSRWLGFSESGTLFEEASASFALPASALVLAMGGGSWPRLGSDGAWMPVLEAAGVPTRALRPANCGFLVAWSAGFAARFAGMPLKTVSVVVGERRVRGDVVVTRNGLEGGPLYTLAPLLREAPTAITIDLRPDVTVEALARRLAALPSSVSMSNRLRKAAGLSPVGAGLLREANLPRDAEALAAAIKAVPVRLDAPAPLAEAISTAGGVTLEGLDDTYGIATLPGVFAAGEMLDWEAPTGGYLLQAAIATGRAAARGVLARG